MGDKYMFEVRPEVTIEDVARVYPRLLAFLKIAIFGQPEIKVECLDQADGLYRVTHGSCTVELRFDNEAPQDSMKRNVLIEVMGVTDTHMKMAGFKPGARFIVLYFHGDTPDIRRMMNRES
jgi:hypothetical protein